MMSERPFAIGMPDTLTVGLSVWTGDASPIPSWPWSFRPQQTTLLSSRSTHVCSIPVATIFAAQYDPVIMIKHQCHLHLARLTVELKEMLYCIGQQVKFRILFAKKCAEPYRWWTGKIFPFEKNPFFSTLHHPPLITRLSSKSWSHISDNLSENNSPCLSNLN